MHLLCLQTCLVPDGNLGLVPDFFSIPQAIAWIREVPLVAPNDNRLQ